MISNFLPTYFSIYFSTSAISIIVILVGLIAFKKEKETFLKKVVSIFDKKISKYNIGIVIMIGFLLFFSIMLVIDLLSYFSMLKIASDKLIVINLYELVVIWIYIFIYILITSDSSNL